MKILLLLAITWTFGDQHLKNNSKIYEFIKVCDLLTFKMVEFQEKLSQT